MQELNKELKIKASEHKVSLPGQTRSDSSLNHQLIKKNWEVLLVNEARFYPASTKEWSTSIYSYNKANIKNTSVKNKLIYVLLNSYFNLKKNKIKGVSNSNTLFNLKNYTLPSFAKKNIKTRKFSKLLVKAKLLKNLYLLKQWKINSINNLSINTSNKENSQLINDNNLLKLKKINKSQKNYLRIIKLRILKKIRRQVIKKKNFLKKTYVSIPEIKDLNNKSIITVSIYNRNNEILKRKIYKLYKMFILKKHQKKTLVNYIKESKKIDYSLIDLLKKELDLNKSKLNSSNNLLYKDLSNFLVTNKAKLTSSKLKISLLKKIYLFLSKEKAKNSLFFALSEVSNSSKWSFTYLWSDLKKINLKKFKKIQQIIRKKYKKILKYKYYIMLLSFYKFRLNNNNLLGLKNITRKIFNKKIVFRIINLKYMYLDSNILAEAITKKLRDRKKKIIRILKKVMHNIKKVDLVRNLWDVKSLNQVSNIENSLDRVNNSYKANDFLIDSSKAYSIKTPITDLLTNEELVNKSDKKQSDAIKGLVLYSLKHKVVSGLKVQGSGRLTKRLTASRAITKSRSKGSLQDINSSKNGYSSVMLRGHFKSNLQYVNINSYNRNGSFGVKTWITS